MTNGMTNEACPGLIVGKSSERLLKDQLAPSVFDVF